MAGIGRAAHYRLYFTKNKIRTNIVFYMNEHDRYSKLNNTIYNKKYREKYISDYTDNPHYETVNSIMKSALTGLDTIIDYIDSVYFVTSERIESSLLPYLIVKDKMLDGQFNIMVTKDPYDLQYVNKNFLVIYPSQDKSKILTKTNLWDLLRDEGDISSDVNLPSYLYSFMLSTIGDKRRGIGKIKGVGWNSIYKNILKLFKKFDIDMEDEIISFPGAASGTPVSGSFAIPRYASANRNVQRIIARITAFLMYLPMLFFFHSSLINFNISHHLLSV